MIDFRPFGNLLNDLMYTDTMNIIGYTDTLDEDGATIQESVIVAKNVPCKLDFDNLDNPDSSTVDRDRISVVIRVFCGLDTPISKGNTVIAQRNDQDGRMLAVYYGQAGLPAPLLYHTEFMLLQEGQA